MADTTAYRRPGTPRALIEEHRQQARDAPTLTGLEPSGSTSFAMPSKPSPSTSGPTKNNSDA